MQVEPQLEITPRAPDISYREQALEVILAQDQVLAVLDFANPRTRTDDPRVVPVHLLPWQTRKAREVWQVSGPVTRGRAGPVSWAMGGGWLLAAVLQPDDGSDVGAATRTAYHDLTTFLRGKPDFHVQRIWNYLDRINDGEGDKERYRQFCIGRLQGMDSYFADGFPAATAIGHSEASGYLQVFCLATRTPGQRIENPRQMSAWRYPRQYGPVAPSFARAMRLPAGDGLAISGTAAIQGHRSLHGGDLEAQLQETLTNLRSLLSAGSMQGDFGAQTPLKVYVRHTEHMAEVDAFLAKHLPQSPRLLLQADICRRELLVEIDGWHFV